jgi:hypothetical protein
MSDSIVQNGNDNPVVDNGNANNTQQWYETSGIDSTLLTDKIRGFSDVNAFVKSYNEAQSFIGKGIPDENTPEDIKNAFYEKLGRPKTPDGYEWKLPDGLTVDGANPENINAIKKICHDVGMSNKQVNAVLGHWSNVVESIIQQQMQARQTIMNESKATLSAPNEWGDKYATKLDSVLKRIDELGIRQHLEEAGVLYNAKVLKAFDSVIGGAKETKLKGADGKYISPNERLEQLRNHDAYFKAGHPEHQAVVEEVNRIYAQMAAR